MAGSSSTLADPQVVLSSPYHDQVQHIIASNTFRSAPTLQQLLRFLAAKAMEVHPEEIKEYTIGVESLGRRQDFDPKTDPIVRVQVYRLRQKLKEYYEFEGLQDSILVEIPKGHYLPRFETLPLATSHVPVPEPDAESDLVNPPVERSRDTRVSAAMLAAILVAMIVVAAGMFAVGFWIGDRHRTESANTLLNGSVQSLGPATDPVKAFWMPFLKEDPSPIIAYADAIFLLDDSSDLFRFRRGASDDRGAPVDLHLARQFASNPALVTKAGPLFYDNGYTGTGELQAAAMLTALFTKMGATPTVESSYDITTSDLKQHNVILLGSPFQNVAVQQLPPSGDFLFVDPISAHDLWNGRIFNTHPRSDEKVVYQTERDPETHVLKADYALITFQPGVVAGRHIVDLGGLDTTGTEGAVLLATTKSGIEELMRDAGPTVNSLSGRVPTFQALLRVNLEKGYQVLDTSVIAVHSLDSDHASAVKPPPSVSH
jgi:hypothetical protein